MQASQIILLIVIVSVIVLVSIVAVRQNSGNQTGIDDLECKSDADCGGDLPVCDSGVCVECVFNTDCPGSDVCVSKRCEAAAVVEPEAPSFTCEFPEFTVELDEFKFHSYADPDVDCQVDSCDFLLIPNGGDGSEAFSLSLANDDLSTDSWHVLLWVATGVSQFSTQTWPVQNDASGISNFGLVYEDDKIPLWTDENGGTDLGITTIPYAVSVPATFDLTEGALGSIEINWEEYPDAEFYYAFYKLRVTTDDGKGNFPVVDFFTDGATSSFVLAPIVGTTITYDIDTTALGTIDGVEVIVLAFQQCALDASTLVTETILYD